MANLFIITFGSRLVSKTQSLSSATRQQNTVAAPEQDVTAYIRIHRTMVDRHFYAAFYVGWHYRRHLDRRRDPRGHRYSPEVSACRVAQIAHRQSQPITAIIPKKAESNFRLRQHTSTIVDRNYVALFDPCSEADNVIVLPHFNHVSFTGEDRR